MRSTRWVLPWVLVAACWGDNAHIVEGTVVEVSGPNQLVVAHEAIDSLGMPAMTMPFAVKDPASLEGVRAGDQIYARLMIEGRNSYLEKIRVSGHGEVPGVELGGPLRVGEKLPAIDVPVAAGGIWRIGEGAGTRVAVAFVYTTCPLADYCPATMARLSRLQDQVRGARLLAVTIDPDHDSLADLAVYASQYHNAPGVWQMGRVTGDAFQRLTGAAAIARMTESKQIIHNLRLMVFDTDGTLIERYDDNNWEIGRVASQLNEGTPKANEALMPGTITEPTPRPTAPAGDFPAAPGQARPVGQMEPLTPGPNLGALPAGTVEAERKASAAAGKDAPAGASTPKP